MAQVDQTPHASAPKLQIGSRQSASPTNGPATDAPVNRKKQKRRQKQKAARLAAEQSLDSVGAQGSAQDPSHDYSAALSQAHRNGYDYSAQGGSGPEGQQEGQYYTEEDARYADAAPASAPNGKSKKKSKSGSRSVSQGELQPDYASSNKAHLSSLIKPNPPPPPPLSTGMSTSAMNSAHRVSKDRIWNTSTQEERERIKEFWLSLEEQERRSLVKVEKEAVLKKMKEQQKHSCSCTVCGRKRTAIEEELEVLYDAYYEELEQYANHQQISLENGAPMMPPPRMYAHSMSRLPPNGVPPMINGQRPSRGRVRELMEDEEDGDEEEYSDEEDEEEYSEEELGEEPRGPASDFFNFGNSLTVQGGILTVADDLLKNDGKKFIEMMEQLAERRMQREEEAQFAAAGLGHPSLQGHNHGPPLDEEDYDDEEEEEYDSQEDEEYDEDEMETMTEEQRMEEGRRMFQIFAARMFEQRVLTAYREKVSRERQEKLLEELAEESRLDTQREAKKAKEAQKKKDKKRQQKQAKEEEKAKREADRAAEEAAARAIEEKKLEEQRQKKEEQRKKRELEKKAQDEERQRKEAEKQKRLQEARLQQAETERKQREQKEREKKKREEVKRKEREERETKDREAREKKEREAAEKRERDAKIKAEKDTKDQLKKEEPALKHSANVVPVVAPSLKRNITSTAVPIPPGLYTQSSSSNHASPHPQVATPVIPKAPTPVRQRQASVQSSQNSSPNVSQAPSGIATGPAMAQTLPPNDISMTPVSNRPPSHIFQQSQTASTLTHSNAPPGMTPQPISGALATPPIGNATFSTTFGPPMPGMVQRTPHGLDNSLYTHQPPLSLPQYRNIASTTGLPFPPGMNGTRSIPSGRGVPMDPPAFQAPSGPGAIGNPGIGTQYHSTMPSHSRSHSRQTSASFDRTSFDTTNASSQVPTQPIARPAPIQRPSSVAPHQQGEESHPSTKADIDDLSNHLGSSALLDDTDVPLNSNVDEPRHPTAAPGAPRPSRLGFGASTIFPDSVGSAKIDHFNRGAHGGAAGTWGTPSMGFGGPSAPGGPSWSTTPGAGWSNNNSFGIIGGPNRQSTSRPVMIRTLASQACTRLSATNRNQNNSGFCDIETILRQVDHMRPVNEGPVKLKELLDICDTEGNAQNGGGSFVIQHDSQGATFVKFEADMSQPMASRAQGGPGEIGSPIAGNNMHSFAGGRSFQLPAGPPSGF